MAYRQKDYTYNPKLTTEENVLLDRLFKFKLSHMAEALEQQFLNPNSELEDFHTRITALINYEWDQRQSTKFKKLLRKATLKYPNADFDKSLYEPDRMLDTHTIEKLQTCKWIDAIVQERIRAKKHSGPNIHQSNQQEAFHHVRRIQKQGSPAPRTERRRIL